VRSVRAIRFYEVVPLDALLAAMANDAEPVQRRLVKLLLPSYCPAGATLDSVAERCVALLEQAPAAGAVLCKWMMAEGAPAATALALANSLQSLLLSSKAPAVVRERESGPLELLASFACELGTMFSVEGSIGER